MTDQKKRLADLYMRNSFDSSECARAAAKLLEAHRQDIMHIAESVHRFSGMVQDTAARIGAALRDLHFDSTSDLLREIAKIAGGVHVLTKAVEGGWLPHYTSPRLSWENPLDSESVSEAYEAHYRQNWGEVKDQFRQLVRDLDIDLEAKSTFEEALALHEQGFYRSTVRLIFPELERVARVELCNDSVRHPLTSQKRLREEVLSLTSDDVQPGGLALGALAEQLRQHIYEKADTEEARARFRSCPIPNRHAALHGLVTYASHQNSINALIIADFSFQVIAAAKRAASP